MTRRTLLSVVALAIILTVAGFVLLRLLDQPHIWPPDDYVEYWSAGRLNLTGNDPYSAEQLLPLERYAGRDTDEAIMMWNPPWTLTLVMPLGALPPRIGQLVWFFLSLGSIGFSAWLVWQTFDGRREQAWIPITVALTFLPSLCTLQTGQISAFLLLGVAAFVWCTKRGYLFGAGAAACLIAIKPHLAYLLWLAIGLDALFNRRWKIVIGGLVVGVIVTAIPMAFNPNVWSQYIEAYRSSPVPPAKWVSLTLGVVLRLILGIELFWLQFVPMLVGLVWFAWHWQKYGKDWTWAEQISSLIAVSFVTAPYGAWHFDLVLLLIPILYRSAKWSNSSVNQSMSSPTSTAATTSQPIWLIPLVILGLVNVMMLVLLNLGAYSIWFAWVAPVVLLTYMFTDRRPTSLERSPALTSA